MRRGFRVPATTVAGPFDGRSHPAFRPCYSRGVSSERAPMTAPPPPRASMVFEPSAPQPFGPADQARLAAEAARTAGQRPPAPHAHGADTCC